LGIQLAAMACFDTKRAAIVFSRLYDKETATATATRKQQHHHMLMRFADTHPPTRERFEFLAMASETENAEKYEDCSKINRRLQNVLKKR
jgi:Zn-dependent protease with chaperone function